MHTHAYPHVIRTILCLVILLALSACTPAAVLEPQTGQMPVSEPATPTPEVFNPLNPSPTPSGSTLPMTCQVTDLNTYVSKELGYCLAFPLNFTLDESQASGGIIRLDGPAVENSGDPLRASVEITAQPVPEGSELTRLVDAYLASFGASPAFGAPPAPIERTALSLAGEPAEVLAPIPGLLSSQVVMALHGNTLFSLRFHPVDAAAAKPDLEAALQTVTGSFAFLPEPVQSGSQLRTLSWLEFGQKIELSYDPILAPWADALTIPAVPTSDQILYAESRPAHVQFRFLGYQGGRVYDLPLLPADHRTAQVMVFQTRDFPGYGDDHPQGFTQQQQALADLLESGMEPARCAQPHLGYEAALPFLPWLNSQQAFCAQPQILEFSQGKGVRYLTSYLQGPGPVLDQWVFYTFQGMTSDGQFYISAVFPVQTGIFPSEAPPCPKCGQAGYDPFAEWTEMLTGQLAQLEALPEDGFAPSLALLDAVIRSIRIEP